MKTNENDKPIRKYKRYDDAFKRQAVEHEMLSGKAARIVAGELDINEQSAARRSDGWDARSVAGGEQAVTEGVAPGSATAGHLKTLGYNLRPAEGGLNG